MLKKIKNKINKIKPMTIFFLLSKLMKRGAMDANIWFTFVERDGMNKLNSKGGSTVQANKAVA